MDSFELNKIFSALLVALLIGAMCDVISSQAVKIKQPKEFAFKIEVKQTSAGGAPKEEKIPDVAELLKTADLEAGKAAFGKCAQCHSLGAGGKNMVGPNLHNIVGVAKASKAGYGYSKALKNKGGDWTDQDLYMFLLKPRKYLPGTKMSFAGIKNHKTRANLVAFLKAQK